ncbi:hypothetical protein RR46_15303 [Papilio xuthus]|uniref:Uncharacterized protein n=1 Tax=Papilio xuthus TaxID=66420 RepID=A0A194PGG5_PAPXU|nr:hypothetical protein RR46_15303 [Papilio xuthus]
MWNELGVRPAHSGQRCLEPDRIELVRCGGVRCGAAAERRPACEPAPQGHVIVPTALASACRSRMTARCSPPQLLPLHIPILSTSTRHRRGGWRLTAAAILQELGNLDVADSIANERTGRGRTRFSKYRYDDFESN